ncbi:MAG TPA: hypothetical protein VMM92_05930 [Thermoanaerobaculia bacterium]|nr:hypothetical protein [Thermoanaerobaculia bacterium]
MKRRTARAGLALFSLAAALVCGAAGAGEEPGMLATTPSGEVSLGNAPVQIEIPLTADARKRIEELADQTGGHLRLAIDGIKLLHPGAAFEIYLNLPEGQRPPLESPYRVGNLSLFSEPGGTNGLTRTFDILDKVRALRHHGKWDGRLVLTIFREDLSGKRLGGPGKEDAFLRFSRVYLTAS